MSRLLKPLVVTALLTGCTVGPNYQKPAIAIADQWLEPATIGEVDRLWWHQFKDPALAGLIDRALASSPDLKEAQARVAEARANRDASAGRRLPEVTAKGSATDNRVSENGQLPVANIPGFDPRYSLYDIGFDASWELDLWGRNRRGVEAASARAEAAEWSRRDIMLTLISEIARNYVELRKAQADEALAQGDLDANGSLSRLTALRYRAGEANRIEADEAASQRASSEATLEQVRAGAAVATYRIATLVGVAPEAIVPQLRVAAPIPLPPATIASGVRSELLQRRADIRRAEREYAAATADIGAARADLFPRFSLLGNLGQQARSPGDLLSSASTRFSIGPSFSWPIFSFGRIRAQIRASDARADAAAARYEKTVVSALSDSESAANRFARSASALMAARKASQREQSAFDLTTLRARRGEGDNLSLARAKLRLLQVRRADADASAAYSISAVVLFKTLGGGWQEGN